MSLKAPLPTPMIVALWLITLPLASPQRQLWAAPAAELGLSSRAQQRLRNAERLWDQRRFAEASQTCLPVRSMAAVWLARCAVVARARRGPGAC